MYIFFDLSFTSGRDPVTEEDSAENVAGQQGESDRPTDDTSTRPPTATAPEASVASSAVATPATFAESTVPAAAGPAENADPITPPELLAADVVDPSHGRAEAAAGGAGLVDAASNEHPEHQDNHSSSPYSTSAVDPRVDAGRFGMETTANNLNNVCLELRSHERHFAPRSGLGPLRLETGFLESMESVFGPISTPSRGLPFTAAPSPDRAPATVTSPEQGLSDPSFSTPSTPTPSPRRPRFSKPAERRFSSPTRRRSWPRSGVYTMASPTFSAGPSPSLPIDEDPAWDAASRPVTPVGRSSIPVPENNAPSSPAPVPALGDRKTTVSRVTFKQMLLTEALKWQNIKDLDKLKELMRFEDDNNRSYIPNPDDLRRQRKRYEDYARGMSLQRARHFHVYGTEELYGHDRLRCWVKLYLHMNPETPFPPGYTPVTNESDQVSVAGTLYTQDSYDAESTDSDSDSSAGRGG